MDPDIKVRVALDTDPDDPAPAWTDITSRVHYGDGGQPVTVDIGRQNETDEIKPTEMGWAVKNGDNAFTPRNPASPYYGKWEQGRRCWITETVDGEEFDLGQGFLEIPDMPIVDPRSAQAVAVTAVDRMGRLGAAPPFAGTLAEHVRVEGGPLAVHLPLTDPYPHASANSGVVTERVVTGFFDQPVNAEPTDLIKAAGVEGPPGDDQSYASWEPVADAEGDAFLARAYLTAPLNIPVGATDVVALSAWVNARTQTIAPGSFRPDATIVAIYNTTNFLLDLGDSKAGIDSTGWGGSGGTVTVVGSRELERDVWRLVTARLDFGSETFDLWVGADLAASGTVVLPAGTTITGIDIGSLFVGAIGHIQVRVGPAASTMTREMHIAQHEHGYRGLQRQTVAERIETLAGYAGIPATEIGELAVVDTFTRTVANGWGSAETGQAWTVVGAAADYSATGTRGRHSFNAVNASRNTVVGSNMSDVDITANVSVPQLAVGGPIAFGLRARVGASSYNLVECRCETDQSITLRLYRVNPTFVQLAVVTHPTETHQTNDNFALRFQVIGSTLRAKLWHTPDAEPVAWTVEATDPAPLAAGGMGTRSEVFPGNTNTPPLIVDYDNIVVRVPIAGADTPLQVARLAGVTPASALRTAAVAGQDTLTTDGQGKLTLIPRGRRYNQPVSLQIPFGWIGYRGLRYRPDRPVTDVTVTRTGGGTVRRSDPVRARRYGVTGQQYDLDTAIDADPANLASWALAAFGQQRTRCPSIRINMLRRTLAERKLLLGLKVGDRIQLTGLPPGSPEDVPHLIVQGVKHTIGPGRIRVIEFNTSPLLGPTPGVPPACPMVGDLVATTAIVAY